MEKIKSGEKFSVAMDKINKTIEHCVPTGSVLPYSGVAAPDGWLLCDGSSYSVETYPELAQTLGYSMTVSHFKVPDLQNKYLKGNTKTTDGISSDGGTLWVSNGKSSQYGGGSSTGYAVFSTKPGAFDLPFVGLNFIIKY